MSVKRSEIPEENVVTKKCKLSNIENVQINPQLSTLQQKFRDAFEQNLCFSEAEGIQLFTDSM